MKCRTAFTPAPSLILAFVLAAGSGAACRKEGPPAGLAVTKAEIEAHIRFLSDDLLEGRGLGSRGIDLAALYQENEFRAYGLEPAFGDSFRQSFDLRGCRPDPKAAIEVIGGEKPPVLANHKDFIVKTFRTDVPPSVEAPVVYGGFLIQAPERQWDDIKGADIKGKIILCEINEPGNAPGGLFDGEDMTYYGRWTYKFEKAAALGAAGCLIIHNTKGAAYNWDVVVNSWSRENFFLPDKPQTLFFQGWLNGDTAQRVLASAGLDRAELAARAEKADFAPVPVPLKVRVSQKPTFRDIRGANVAAIRRGKLKAGKERFVVFSAHYDHFGRNERLEGDQVFNGALDNCSASAALLALARYYAQSAKDPELGFLFAAVTGEEENMLGSDYLTRHLPMPVSSILADLNLEMTNVWGETEDVYTIGGSHSDLDEIAARAAANLGLRYIPERSRELGYFFRSDQISFVRNGIPAVWLHEGIVSKTGGADFITAKAEDYRKTKYHNVKDEIQPDWDLAGTVQIVRWAEEIVSLLAARPSLPQFKPTSSFRR